MREERDPSDLGLPWLPADDPAPVPGLAHKCRGGLTEDKEGRPVPCVVCRPWLAGAAAAARNMRRSGRE